MSQKKKETLPPKKTMPVVSEEEEKLQISKTSNNTRVSNWLLVIGIGAVVAVATAGTVYYYRRKKSRLAWEDESEGYSIDYYKSTFNRYWSLTKKTFSAVTISVNEFFSKDKNFDTPLFGADQESSFLADTQDHEEAVLYEL